MNRFNCASPNTMIISEAEGEKEEEGKEVEDLHDETSLFKRVKRRNLLIVESLG